jgi:hypothetical protein
MSGGQWIHEVDPENQGNPHDVEEKWKRVGTFGSIGMDPVQAFYIRYEHDDSLIRLSPKLLFRDIDEAMFLPIMNRSLAQKLRSIHVISNGYKLQEIGPEDFHLEEKPQYDTPIAFSALELEDPWVIVRPRESSLFEVSFSDTTPARLFESRKAPSLTVKR